MTSGMTENRLLKRFRPTADSEEEDGDGPDQGGAHRENLSPEGGGLQHVK